MPNGACTLGTACAAEAEPAEVLHKQAVQETTLKSRLASQA